VLYDVTTLYFEAEKEDDLRKVGYSKERRVDPQVVVGLLVDSAGFPLEIHCFPGNKAETETLVPVPDAFKQRHDTAELIVVCDAGMLSDVNLRKLEDAGYEFIVGSRAAKTPKDLAEHFASGGRTGVHGQIVEAKTLMGRGGTHLRRVVYQFSRKRHRRENENLDKERERALFLIAGETRGKKPRFVKEHGGDKSFDEYSFHRAREAAGWKGYVTNVHPDNMTGAEVIAAYHDLWQVERSFRMAKSDLDARPMYHHREQSIQAHLTMVFVSLGVSRHLQEATGYSIKKIVQALQPLHDVTINMRGHEFTAVTPATGNAETILNTLNPDAQKRH
jgi:transposase